MSDEIKSKNKKVQQWKRGLILKIVIENKYAKKISFRMKYF